MRARPSTRSWCAQLPFSCPQYYPCLAVGCDSDPMEWQSEPPSTCAFNVSLNLSSLFSSVSCCPPSSCMCASGRAKRADRAACAGAFSDRNPQTDTVVQTYP